MTSRVSCVYGNPRRTIRATLVWKVAFQMNEATFPSPTAEMAEMNRIQYEIEYTEGISQRMRVPEKLKVAPTNTSLELEEELPNTGVIMQVPERIVIAGDNEDVPFSRPPDLDLIQSTPFETLALKTPPRVLTLSERPLDFLDLERPLAVTPQNEEIRALGRLKRERSMSENAIRQNGQLVRNDSMWHGSSCVPKHELKASFQASVSTKKRIIVTPTQQQARVCPPQMIPEDGANLYSARGILSFIQSSTRRAYQQVLEVLDDSHRFKMKKWKLCRVLNSTLVSSLLARLDGPYRSLYLLTFTMLLCKMM
uniref:Mitochondrial fission factor n=1 Tax=Geotrypetes seraphini TaxID=260995 RepID=A0A6P8S811_GEOSA|nr:mitochondrial fission factor isoform X6 [Geotrypetes seraphini]